jgi:hypothetical protein
MLFHIFESEWIEKQQIVKSRLKSALGFNNKIYARNCKIQSITSQEAELFYNKHHIQGSTKNQFNYALINNNMIVACMSFNKPRFTKKYDIELTRFCTLSDHNVVGGASKLFKHFINKHHNINTIISYSDKRWSQGNLYKTLNFLYSHTSSPNYWYFKCLPHLFSRMQFQKHKLKTLFENYNDQLTEWENMKNNGYDRIWDCGNDVWVWTRNA